MSSTPSKAAWGSEAKGAARRTTAARSSTCHSSMATMATICWASTSRGLRGWWMASMAPARMRSTTTAHSRRSPRHFGMSTPRLVAPTWCPARPTRCSPDATDGGDSTCTTRSTAPMSIPSSRDDVATTAGRRPALRSSSMRRRRSRLTDPWWARAISSPAVSFSRAHRRSARRRELAKTMVERTLRIISTRCSSMAGQMVLRSGAAEAERPLGISSCTLPTSAMSSTGTWTVRSKFFWKGGCTMVTSRSPPRRCAISSRGRTVADSPMRRAGRGRRRSSRSRLRARWDPRLPPAMA